MKLEVNIKRRETENNRGRIWEMTALSRLYLTPTSRLILINRDTRLTRNFVKPKALVYLALAHISRLASITMRPQASACLASNSFLLCQCLVHTGPLWPSVFRPATVYNLPTAFGESALNSSALTSAFVRAYPLAEISPCPVRIVDHARLYFNLGWDSVRIPTLGSFRRPTLRSSAPALFGRRQNTTRAGRVSRVAGPGLRSSDRYCLGCKFFACISTQRDFTLPPSRRSMGGTSCRLNSCLRGSPGPPRVARPLDDKCSYLLTLPSG